MKTKTIAFRIVPFFVAFFLTTTVFAQEVTITGTVFDAELPTKH